jgi:hypothetical protein
MKRFQGAFARCGDCREWRNVGRIPAGFIAGHGEVTVLRSKSVPNRICEEILWQISHFFNVLSSR